MRASRHRESFDEVADLYDQARPSYPDELVDDLFSLSGVEPGGRVLEIGCGTGQLSTALVARGASLTAVELGENMARVARRKLPEAEIIVSSFEDWPVPAEPFDLVVSATAFHWLDPEIRVEKSANLLGPQGSLALIDTYWAVEQEADEFSQASQECYASWDPDYDPDFEPLTLGDLPPTKPELEDSGRFDSVEMRQYKVERQYDTKAYLALLGTYSNILGLDEKKRIGLLRCLGELIDERFGGHLVRHDICRLWVAHNLPVGSTNRGGGR